MNLTQQRTVYQGKIVTLELADATLPTGASVAIEIVHHPGGAAVVAVDSQRRVCLLRHWRPAVSQWVWEIPAGKLDGGEEPHVTARRELLEEAGVAATEWHSLGRVLSSPGVFTEVVHLFLATALTHRDAAPDADEVFETSWVLLEEAVDRAQAGDIIDAKSVAALCRAQRFLRE